MVPFLVQGCPRTAEGGEDHCGRENGVEQSNALRAPFIVFQVVIISRNRNVMLLTGKSISNRLAKVRNKSTVFVAKNLSNFTVFLTYIYLKARQFPLNYQQIYNTDT